MKLDMGSSTFDCYLCGTTNSADADFCAKCSGRLLKITDSEDDQASSDHDDAVQEPVQDESFDGASFEFDDSEFADETSFADSADAASFHEEFFNSPANVDTDTPGSAPSSDHTPASPPPEKSIARKARSNVADQRLADALGMTEDPAPAGHSAHKDYGEFVDENGEVGNLDYIHTDVTSIPTTRGAENIPVLGTAGAPNATMYEDDEEVGKIAYVIVAMLFLAVGWLGYDILIRDSSSASPDTIGFVDTTTTTSTTPISTTTEVQTVTMDEVDSTYRNAFVRLVPYICAGGVGEAVGDAFPGVAINETSVAIGSGLPEGTNVIRIVTRTGRTRTAVVSTESGYPIATSITRTANHLDISEVGSVTTFYVGYDFDSRIVTTSDVPQDFDTELAVSDMGDVVSLRLDEQIIDGETLAGIDLVVELDPDATIGPSVCSEAAAFVLTNPAALEGELDEELVDGESE